MQATEIESILRAALSLDEVHASGDGGHYQVIVPVETERALLRPDTLQLTDETDLIPRFAEAKTIIAVPMYAPIIPAESQLIRLPHEGFSGRLYAKEIPNLITQSGFAAFRAKYQQ